jgi:amino acid transporter
VGISLILFSQAAINHLGIRAPTRMTDFSGYWILAVAACLTLSLLAWAPAGDFSRLTTFTNFSGVRGAQVWPQSESFLLLFSLGLLLPAYTITGFDASAHTAEETVEASHNVPRGILRSVFVSGVAGWVMLIAVIVSAPSLSETARHGEGAFRHVVVNVLPRPLSLASLAGILVAQYLCGLATVTSASRMAYAFARDGGLPCSSRVRWVCPRFQTPAIAIWAVTVAAALFTFWSPVYATITSVCTILLYISYVLPSALGFRAFGRTWITLGPWHLGRWYKPLALTSVVGCLFLIVIGMWPPNERAAWAVGGFAFLLGVGWLAGARRAFPGPPILSAEQAD